MDIDRHDIIDNKYPLYLRLDTNRELIKRLSRIDVFKGKWIIVESRKHRNLDKLKKVAIIDSILASTKMDGIDLPKEEAEKIIKSNNTKDLKTTQQQKLFGYAKCLFQIQNNYHKLNLSENLIKQQHELLLKYVTEDKQQPGRYKKQPNTIVLDFPDNDQPIILETTKPKLVQKELSELLDWTQIQIRDNNIHPLIVIATFLYEFLLIQPFQNANGLISRLLTNLLLLKYEFYFVKYISLEQIIEQRKDEYYKALISGRQNRRPGDELIENWLFYFIHYIEVLINKLESKHNIVNQKGVYLNERQKKLREFISKSQPVKISDIEKSLHQYSRNTLKKDLAYLIDESMISKFGERKGTVYIIESDE